jgi:hypothetical protein
MMTYATIAKKYAGKKPNLGDELTLNLVAKDDARFVELVPVEYIAYGIRAMPFLHPWFALDYYTNYQPNPEFAHRLEVIYQLARMRNHRIMRKVNQIIATKDGKKQFQITEMSNIVNVLTEARELGIDTSKYLDETTDEDDVQQCSNDWCLNQNPVCGKAADNVQIINDLDGTEWLVLIVRQFGPGRAQLAWAGGLVDKDETFKAAALREKDEETEVSLSSNKPLTQARTRVTVTTTLTELKPVKMMDWDPRAKFVEGMEVGAVVTYHKFRYQF